MLAKLQNTIINRHFFSLFIFHLQLDVQLQDEAGGDISSFITNGEWDLLGKFFVLLCILCYRILKVGHFSSEYKREG